MRSIQNYAAFFFVAAVAVLTIISVFGVWGIFAHDVILKSFETLGLLAVVSVVVIIASHYIELRGQAEQPVDMTPNPAFRTIRRGTLAALVVFAVLLAFIGILAIWNVIQGNELVWKSLGSLMVAVFGSLIIVLTCLEREKIQQKGVANGSSGIASLVALIIVCFLIGSALLSMFSHF